MLWAVNKKDFMENEYLIIVGKAIHGEMLTLKPFAITKEGIFES